MDHVFVIEIDIQETKNLKVTFDLRVFRCAQV